MSDPSITYRETKLGRQMRLQRVGPKVLAERARIPEGSLTHYQYGRSLVPPRRAAVLARALGVEVGEVIGWAN